MGVRMRLIDWIWVILISGVGLAVAVRGLNSSRETNCRGSCQYNLRQISLGLNAYRGIHGVYPPSADLAKGHSCFLIASPEMESPDAFNLYDFSRENWSTIENSNGISNAVLNDTRTRLWTCPDSNAPLWTPASEIVRLDGSHYPGSARFGRGSYAVNWGGGRQGWGSEFEQLYGGSRGPMNPTGKLGLQDVIDGAASTILVGEKMDSFGWNVGGWAGSEFDVGTQPGYEGDEPLARKVYSGSYHGVGLNFAFADGSVRFLSNGIERNVWYAILTRNGREVIDQDDIVY